MSRPHTMPAAVLSGGPVVSQVERQLLADRPLLIGVGRIVVRRQPIAPADRQPLHQPAARNTCQIPLHATQLPQLDCL
jgi:hypothetical protein